MLYPKSRKLDPGMNTELRMLKIEDQRINAINLVSNLNKFALTLEQLSSLELKIADDLMKLYPNESIYGDMIYNLSKALTFKANIVKRELKALKDSIDKNKNIEAMYNSLRPLINHYFKSVDTNLHYNQKLPKVIDMMEGKKKMKGELTIKETEKIVRNKRKLENAETDLKVVNESLLAETNKLNLERFDKLNKITKEFINTEVSMTFLMTEKFGLLDNFDELLAAKENEQFNNKYFMDINKESKLQILKSSEIIREKSIEPKSPVPIKQKIQNNYYYVNADENGGNIKKFNPDDVIVTKDSQAFGKPENLSNSKHTLPNNKSNMIEYPNINNHENKGVNVNNNGMTNDSRMRNDNVIELPYQ